MDIMSNIHTIFDELYLKKETAYKKRTIFYGGGFICFNPNTFSSYYAKFIKHITTFLQLKLKTILYYTELFEFFLKKSTIVLNY